MKKIIILIGSMFVTLGLVFTFGGTRADASSRKLFIHCGGLETEFTNDLQFTINDDFEANFNDADVMCYEWEIVLVGTSEIYLLDTSNNIIGDVSIKNGQTIDFSNGYIKYDSKSVGAWEIGDSFKFSFERPATKPAISGSHSIVNNIDSPYTLARVREIANIKAIDAYYGDITSDIEVVRDDFTPNHKTVGNFEIEFKVTNASNLSTTFILIMTNKDLTKPVISGPGMSTMSYTETFNEATFLTKFTVTDNYYENLKIVIDSTTHVANKIGTYQFKLSAKDPSNNIGNFTHTLNIVDDVKPTMTDTNEGIIEVNWKDTPSNATLLMGITAHDAIDGDITSKIKVVDNPIKSELGTYTVRYEVTDVAGNKTTYSRTYKVVTTDAPIFWISKNLLLISDVNAMTNEQLAQEIARYEGIQMASFAFITNEYEDSNQRPGEYTVKLAIADTKGEEHIVERTMQVFADSELPEPELNFFQVVWNFIVKVATTAWNAIVAIWNFFAKLLGQVFSWIK